MTRPDHPPTLELTPEQIKEKYPPTRLARLGQRLKYSLEAFGVSSVSEFLVAVHRGEIDVSRAKPILSCLRNYRDELETRTEKLEKMLGGASEWQDVVLAVARMKKREDEEKVLHEWRQKKQDAQEEYAQINDRECPYGFDYGEFIDTKNGALNAAHFKGESYQKRMVLFHALIHGDSAAIRSLFVDAIGRGGFAGGTDAILLLRALLHVPGADRKKIVRSFRFVLKNTEQMMRQNNVLCAPDLYKALFQGIDEQTGTWKGATGVDWDEWVLGAVLAGQKGYEGFEGQAAPIGAMLAHLDPEGFWNAVEKYDFWKWALLFQLAELPMTTMDVDELVTSQLEQRLLTDWKIKTVIALGEESKARKVEREISPDIDSSIPPDSDEYLDTVRRYAFRELVNIALAERAAAQDK